MIAQVIAEIELIVIPGKTQMKVEDPIGKPLFGILQAFLACLSPSVIKVPLGDCNEDALTLKALTLP